MPSKTKRWVGNNLSRSQVWSFSPPVTATAPNWALTVNGKTLTVVSDGTPANAVTLMRGAWSASQEPEFQEITASVPSSGSVQTNPQGTGTNKINSISISGAPTAGSFKLSWGGAVTPFISDPQSAPSAADNSTSGNLNGAYQYAVTFTGTNAIGQSSETLPSPVATVTVTNHEVLLSGIPLGLAGTTGRNLYRSAGGGSSLLLVASIPDNITTVFLDNVADGALGAAAPTANTTGIPFNATGEQVQNVFQLALMSLNSTYAGCVVCFGAGTQANPWLVQFVNALGAQPQPDITCYDWSFAWPTTVPPQVTPVVSVTEIQVGILPLAVPPSDGNTLILTGPPGVPFFIPDSSVSGTLTPEIAIVAATSTGGGNPGQAANVTITQVSTVVPGITITPIAPTVTAARVTAGAPAVNEVQRITIGPTVQSGPTVDSTVQLSWNGQTTASIPFPPQPCTASVGTSGVLSGVYQWVVTFVTQYGETEPSQAAGPLTLGNQQASLTNIPTGSGVVTARKLYRATVTNGVAGPYLYLATIADNTTTSYADNTPNASLGAEQPPTTNFALQGALEALSNTGQGTIKVGIANVPAWAGHYNGGPIVYDVEFEGSLGGAPQNLITGDVAAVVILPRIQVSEIQRGYAPLNAQQIVGWTQVQGIADPSGAFTITLPGLGVTTLPIAWNASATTVESALVAAAGTAYNGSFSVSSTQATAAGYLYQIEYDGLFAGFDVPLAYVTTTNMTPNQIPTADTVLGYEKIVNHGGVTGEDEVYTVTLLDNANGGTFALTAVLANGTVVGTTSGIANNATAASVASAMNTAMNGPICEVSGGAGGPWTIEFTGALGAQQIVLTALSSLSASTSGAGSPPGSNTTTLAAPTGLAVALQANNTAYNASANNNNISYEVFAYDATGLGPTSGTLSGVTGFGNNQARMLSWNSVAGATGYAVYASDGIKSGYLANLPAWPFSGVYYFLDIGAGYIPQTAGTGGMPQTYLSAANPSSAIGAGNYQNYGGNYYIGTGTDTLSLAAGEVAVCGFAGELSTEFISIGVRNMGQATSAQLVIDNGSYWGGVGGIPSGSSTIAPPTQTTPTASTTGGTLATGTYYYEITAINAIGETTASNEESISVTGPTGMVTINWTESSAGATGFRIYRGTSSGGENVLVGTAAAGATSFFDYGNVTATYSAIHLVNGAAAINEVQSVTVQYAAGGTYGLDFNGASLTSIPYNAAATAVQGFLQGLVTIGPDHCTVSANTSALDITVLTITYTNALGGQALPLIQTSNSLLGTAAYTVALENASGGTFTLAYNGQNTASMSVGASAATLATDLAALSAIGGSAYVSASGPAGGPWIVALDPSVAGKSLLGSVLGATASVTDTITYSGPTGGTFTLNANGETTAAISAAASATSVQSALAAILPGATVSVTGNNGGPWTSTISLPYTQLLGDALNADGTGGVLGNVSPVYVVALKNAIGGSFKLTLQGGTSAAVPYNATPAVLQIALASVPVAQDAAVTGKTGGPWQIAVPISLLSGTAPTMTATSSLTGPSGTIPGYAAIYSYAIGPNFWDAPGNWSDGAPPSAYLPTPPVVASVLPGPIGASKLTGGTTYYYKITALNANGETNGGTEGSGATFVGNEITLNGAFTGGAYTLTYDGQTTGNIAYNAPATGAGSVQSALQALSTVGSGNCTVTGSGTASSPFICTFSGAALNNGAPYPLTATSSLTPSSGTSVSIRNILDLNLVLSWNEVPWATGYKIYRGTSAGGENVLVTTINSPDQTVFLDDGTYTTTPATPPANANAWNTAVGDDVYFNNSGVDCLYNIEHSIVNGYSIHGGNGVDGYNGLNYLPVNSLTIDSTYTGRLGNSRENQLGYLEYRPLELSIVGPPGGIFNLEIGNGNGAGSSLMCLDTGVCQVAGVVNKTAGATVDPAALLWTGSNAATEWDLFYGAMGIAVYPGQTFELATIRQTYQTNESSDTTLEIGPGGTVPTIYKSGGDTLIHCDVTTLSVKGGTVTQDGGTLGALDIEDAIYYSRSTGEITALKVTNDGVFDRSRDSRPVQIGGVSLYPFASFLDPHTAAYTNTPGTLVMSLIECGLQPQDPTGAIVDRGRNTTITSVQN